MTVKEVKKAKKSSESNVEKMILEGGVEEVQAGSHCLALYVVLAWISSVRDR